MKKRSKCEPRTVCRILDIFIDPDRMYLMHEQSNNNALFHITITREVAMDAEYPVDY
jgi:hypothetical protein